MIIVVLSSEILPLDGASKPPVGYGRSIIFATFSFKAKFKAYRLIVFYLAAVIPKVKKFRLEAGISSINP